MVLTFSSGLQSILDHSSDLIFAVENHPPYKLVYANREFKKVLADDDEPKELKDFGVKGENLDAREEFIIRWNNHYYTFLMEESKGESAYLFHKGRKISTTNPQYLEIQRTSAASPELYFEQLLDRLPAAAFQLSMDSTGKLRFDYLSKKIRDLFNLDFVESGDAGIEYLLSKVHPMDVGRVLKSIVHSTRVRENWECEFRIMPSDEDMDPVWVLGMAYLDDTETGVKWYGSVLEITAIKNREQELLKDKEHAEISSNAKSDFISTLIHEVRTPLNAISGSVYSLFEETHIDSQKPLFNTINFAVDNLIVMVNDLLEFQKAQAGKVFIESKPFGLRSLLAQVVDGFAYQAHESKNTLNLVVSERLDVEVLGDKVRLAQALNNLISNALKFTSAGRVDVTATVSHESAHDLKVYFEVKDTGKGISPEDISRVFSEFDQVGYSFDAKYGGTGLGMPITKKLLELMGSDIKVDSELGVGSSFHFELIFPKVAERQSLDAGNDTSTREISPSTKILLAEDNDVNAMVILKMLRRWGLQCDRVTNGLEAVEAFARKHYDIVLMDIQMPKLNGCQAARMIKSSSAVPIIALTASSQNECYLSNDIGGIDRFVHKPINAKELKSNMLELIG